MLSFTEMAVTAQEAADYATSRGYDDWEEDAPALRRGQDYVAGTYNGRWLICFDNDEAPDQVKYAIVEAALREFRTPGSLAPDVVPAQVVKSYSKQVGPLSKSFTYANTGAADMRPDLAIIDGLLVGLVRKKGTSVTMLARA